MELSFGFLINIFVAIYLFIKAPQYGRNKWLWSIFGLVFSFFTLGFFFIATGRKGLGWAILIICIIGMILGALLLFGIFYMLYKGMGG
ncbi:hypothetical protein ACFFJY_03130 [Fictibacillus aquaticus]|uniref:YesK-like protein n=1 Tax=Fictibacillus aquaticus TaxID=2021314 RepID=A0A235F8Q2_9BACL|nr:hypothetical protein [Fictibacillus aquaticus]OYD57690.1 hypothetical protein CGZ90_13585 [Fictibacillus aquaticus]